MHPVARQTATRSDVGNRLAELAQAVASDQATARAEAALEALRANAPLGADDGIHDDGLASHSTAPPPGKTKKGSKRFKVKAAASGNSRTVTNPRIPKSGNVLALPQLVPKPPVREALHELSPAQRRNNRTDKLLTIDTNATGSPAGDEPDDPRISSWQAGIVQPRFAKKAQQSSQPVTPQPELSGTVNSQMMSREATFTAIGGTDVAMSSAQFGREISTYTQMGSIALPTPQGKGAIRQLPSKPVTPVQPLPPRPLFSSVEGARTRRQIFALCQKLFIDSSNPMEVIVKENDAVVWRSTNAEPDPPVKDVELFDEDVDAVRSRAKRAFAKTSEAFHEKLAQVEAQLEVAKAEVKSKSAGGSAFVALQQELTEATAEINRQSAKIKSLVRLLDRAGATIRQQEESREEAIRNRREADQLDWLPFKAMLPDLLTEDRTDQNILHDVEIAFESQLQKLRDIESTSETATERFAEADALLDVYKREHQKMQKETRELTKKLHETEDHLTQSQMEVSDLQYRVRELTSEHENEKIRLMDTITRLEVAARKNMEVKPFFIALGKLPTVQPFLRFEGRVKNLDMPKKLVENVINAIWFSRYSPTTMAVFVHPAAPVSPSARGQANKKPETPLDKTFTVKNLEKQFIQAVTKYVEQQEQGLVGPNASAMAEALAIEPTASKTLEAVESSDDMTAADIEPEGSIRAGGSMRQVPSQTPRNRADILLVDYDNVALWGKKERSTRLSFQDHVLRFLVEQYTPDRVAAVLANYNPATGQPIAGPPTSKKTVNISDIMKTGTSLPTTAAEVAYSLVEGCERFKFDADVELFRRALRGEIPEGAFYDQMIMVQKLKFALMRSGQRLAKEQQRAARIETGTGSINQDPSAVMDAKPSLQSCLSELSEFFPAKAKDSLLHIKRCLCQDVGIKEELVNAVVAVSVGETVGAAGAVAAEDGPAGGDEATAGEGAESNTDGAPGEVPALPSPIHGITSAVSSAEIEDAFARPVNVQKLFASNEHGNQGAFVEAVRDQQLEEVCLHISEASFAIGHLGTATTVGEIQRKLQELDPSKPTEDVNRYVYQLLESAKLIDDPVAGEDGAMRSGAVHLDAPIDGTVLAAQCKQVVYKRYGPVADAYPQQAAASIMAGSVSFRQPPTK